MISYNTELRKSHKRINVILIVRAEPNKILLIATVKTFFSLNHKQRWLYRFQNKKKGLQKKLQSKFSQY